MADGEKFEGWCVFARKIVGQIQKIESSNDFCTTAVNSSPRR